MTAADTRSGIEPAGLLDLLASRRVTRQFGPGAVAEGPLWMVLEAGRWASSASNNRVHRLLVVRDPQRLKLVATMSPGIFSLPATMVVICTDLHAVAAAQLRLEQDRSVFIDVGTMLMNMMIEAHVLGLGTCPVTSFSQAGVGVVLELPPHARPEAILQIGHPAGGASPAQAPRGGPSRLLTKLVYWERYGQAPPPAPIPSD